MDSRIVFGGSVVAAVVVGSMLDRLGGDYAIEVTEVDLASGEGEQLATAGGITFPPGILIDGAPFAHGQSKRQLRRELDRRVR